MRALFRMLVGWRRAERELDAELRFHLEKQREANIAAGLAPDEARRQALIALGGIDKTREEYRDALGLRLLSDFVQDIRYALRQMRRSAGFTAVAAITLALGIGANTAIFSVVDAVLLRPLPIREPERVVVLHDQLPKLNLPRTGISALQFRDYSAHTDLFESTALLGDQAFNLTGGDQPQRVQGMRATASVFPLLGIQPALGRAFTTGDDTYGNQHVVLLSQALWQGMFGGARGAIGQRVQLDGQSYEVVGVLPEQIQLLYPDAQLWIPMALSPEDLGENRRWSLGYTMLARLRPQVAMGRARAEMAAHAARINSFGGFGIEVRSLLEEQVGEVREPLYTLLGGVGLVLLIACVNIANLLLARAGTRSREIGIRAAMGAGRRRIVTQLLTESLLLAVFGGALGLLLANWAIAGLVRLAPANLPHASTIRLDPGVLGFTLVVSLAAGFLFGLAPALHAVKSDLNRVLKASGRSSTEGAGRQALRRTLVISEVALALVLLVCSGLLLRSLGKLLDVNPGFDPANVLTARISLPSARYDEPAKINAFARSLLDRVAPLPGVLYSALASQPPFCPGAGDSTFAIRDYDPGPNAPQPHADLVYSSPNYFAAMRIPLLRGRLYTEAEMLAQGATAGPGAVVVIDEALARRFWRGEDAVGKALAWSTRGPWRTIVGVVGTVRRGNLAAQPEGTIYFPYYRGDMTLVVRPAGDPTSLAAALREQVRAVDPHQPVYNMKTMAERIEASVARRRFAAMLLALFAALALGLALIGLNGVIAYLAAQRTCEIGIRMALGAQRGDIVRLILREGLLMALGGVAAGLAAAFLATRLIATQLFGVRPVDAVTFVAVPVLLTSASLLAGYIPARRAAKVDPVVALRYE
jgi:putative ABC transport system permease protein